MGKKYIPQVLSEEQTRIRHAMKNLLLNRKPIYNFYEDRRLCRKLGLPLPEKTPDVLLWEMDKASKEGMNILTVDF
jgi:hypothetical protein